MKQQTDLEQISASAVTRVTRIVLRVAMVSAIGVIFLSPAAVKPHHAMAEFANPCGEGRTECQAGDDNCDFDPVANTLCTTAANAEAPEMPALLIPLFMAVAGGMTYRIRRKAALNA